MRYVNEKDLCDSVSVVSFFVFPFFPIGGGQATDYDSSHLLRGFEMVHWQKALLKY